MGIPGVPSPRSAPRNRPRLPRPGESPLLFSLSVMGGSTLNQGQVSREQTRWRLPTTGENRSAGAQDQPAGSRGTRREKGRPESLYLSVQVEPGLGFFGVRPTSNPAFWPGGAGCSGGDPANGRRQPSFRLPAPKLAGWNSSETLGRPPEEFATAAGWGGVGAGP